MSTRERLEVDTRGSLMLLHIVAEISYGCLTRPLGLPVRLRVVVIRKVVLSPQHGADGVEEPRHELPFLMGEHIRRGDVHLHSIVQERIGNNVGRDSQERYGAKLISRTGR